MKQQTFFGKILMSASEQQERVHDVFQRVHSRYDFMNDVMSIGMHRLWKRSFIGSLPIRINNHILDLACGTGDIAIGIWQRFKALFVDVSLCDPTYMMLEQAWQRTVNQGWLDASIACARAESLPYAPQTFHGVTCSFGVRNMSNRGESFREIYRVLHKEGWFYMLEFHPPSSPLSRSYIENVIPWMGDILAQNRNAYAYLADSIATFAAPDELVEELQNAGFCKVDYRSLGPVSIHWGYRSQP